MTISALINQLQQVLAAHGDLQVFDQDAAGPVAIKVNETCQEED